MMGLLESRNRGVVKHKQNEEGDFPQKQIEKISVQRVYIDWNMQNNCDAENKSLC